VKIARAAYKPFRLIKAAYTGQRAYLRIYNYLNAFGQLLFLSLRMDGTAVPIRRDSAV
jgi:hypothetical protein